MMLGRIVGNVVASAKHPSLEGKKLLVVQPITRDGNDQGRAIIAIDAVGAGFHETVYWCRGKEAALAFSGDLPCDASIVGIVDSITPAPTRMRTDSPRRAKK
jgi:ethanolamine utilization protein EutN